MATMITINGTDTLDESLGLQNSGVAVTGEDNNDNDVSLATLQANALSFYSRLFNPVASSGLNLSTAFPTANGVAESSASFISVSSTGTVVGLNFVDGNGAALPVYGGATPGVLTGLTTDSGSTISLFADPVLGSQMVLGVDSNGNIAFAVYMQPNGTDTAARVWMTQFEALHNPVSTNPDDPVNLFDSIGVAASVSTEFNFNALPSGQNLFGIVGDADSALVVIGGKPMLNADGTFTNASNTINTSQGGGNITIGIDNQMFDPGESAFFTFVKAPNPSYLAGAVNGLDQNEADDADNIQYTGGTIEGNSAFLKVVQIQANTPASMDIAASNISGAPQGTAFVSALGSGSPVAITAVRVYDSAGTLLEKTSGNGDGGMTSAITITISGGVAHVAGIQAGYKVAWDANGNFDQVKVTDTVGKFDIGGFGVNQPSVASTDIGLQLRFEDDGPTVALSLNPGAEVRVDESLGQNAGETETGSAGLGQVTVARAVLFDTSANFGTDGPASSGSSVWSLSLSAAAADSGLVDTATGQHVLLYLDGGDVVGKTASGGDLVFRIAISTGGDVTLTDYRAMVHSDINDADEATTPLSVAAGLVSAVRTVTDGDADQASQSTDIGPAMKFEDDGPSLTLSLKAGAEVRVDESLGQNSGETEGAAAGLGQVTVARAVLFDTSANFGSDGSASSNASVWSLSLSAAAADSGLIDTATGQHVLLYADGSDVVGKTAIGGDLVFRIAISTGGNVTLTDYRAMVHSDTNNPDEAASPLSIAAGLVSAVRTVTDGDGDHASQSTDIGPAMKFEDDGPSIGPISNGLVNFAANASVTNSLNGAVGQDAHSSPYILTDFTSSITVNGTVLHGVLSGNSQQVSYWADTNHDTVFGNAGDTEFYRLTLNETANSGAGSYTFTALVNPPPAFQEFNFNNLPSGQNLFGTVGTTSSALIVIGGHPVLNADGTMTNASDTINTSQGGGGVTIGVTNQMFDPGESAFFTLVKNPVASYLAGALNGLDQNEADDADNMLYTGGTNAVGSAFVKIVQIQGNSLATMDIKLFDIPGSPQGQDLALHNLGSGTSPLVTAVRVYDANGTKVEDTGDLAHFNSASVSVTITNGVARVSGLGANFKVEFDGSANFDQVKITDVLGKFDVGGFGILQGQDTPDQLLHFTAKVTDGDGDHATADWSIGIDGTGVFHDGIVAGL